MSRTSKTLLNEDSTADDELQEKLINTVKQMITFLISSSWFTEPKLSKNY